MKRERIYKKKEITKIRLRKTKNLITNKRTKKEREPDFLKEMYSGLKLLGKKYKNFREKQEIKKQKEEQIRLKEQEEQRLQEQEQRKLQEQEERKLQKEQTLKEEEERRLEAREKQRLEEKRIKEERQEQEKQNRIRKESIKKEQQERERQEHAYRERVAKGERERLKQLEKVRQLRQEEKQLKEESRFFIEERKLKKERRLEEEQSSKEEGKRLNGKVKWFNGAKGYGFIERKGEEKDIFFHFSAVKKSGLKSLEEGEQLTFEIKNSDKGLSAINLQKVISPREAPVLKLVKKN
jgi:cold shock CspA family protein